MPYQNPNILSEYTPYRGITRYKYKDSSMKAFDIQRKIIKDQEYKELNIQGHSIYFLYGEDRVGNLKVYVGRSSDTIKNVPVFTRLHQHKISTTEYYRDIWDSVIAISFENLSYDEMRNLENYFYKALRPEVMLNSTEPDTNAYQYTDIQRKVECIKEFVTYILKEDVFKKQKRQEAPKEVPKLVYTDGELQNQGKRLVDKQFETVTEVQTPVEVVEQMLDLLPPEIWNPRTKFLDPACTSGEFLKAIFNRLLASPLYDKVDYPNEAIRTLHIISEQLYGIALTETSYSEACKNICKVARIVKIDNFDTILKCFNIFRKEVINLQKAQADNDIAEIKKIVKNIESARMELNKLEVFEGTLSGFLKRRFGEDKDMEIDVIIGNPPYQYKTKTIYNEFIDQAIALNPEHVTMVVKNNWLVSDTLKPTRDNMLQTGVTEIVNYPKVGDLFTDVSAAVSVFDIQKDYTGDTRFREYIKDKTGAL